MLRSNTSVSQCGPHVDPKKREAKLSCQPPAYAWSDCIWCDCAKAVHVFREAELSVLSAFSIGMV